MKCLMQIPRNFPKLMLSALALLAIESVNAQNINLGQGVNTVKGLFSKKKKAVPDSSATNTQTAVQKPQPAATGNSASGTTTVNTQTATRPAKGLFHFVVDSSGHRLNYARKIIEFDNKVYLQCANQLAVYDGKFIRIVPGPEKASYCNLPVVYNGKLYFQYNNRALAECDGQSLKIIKGPDKTTYSIKAAPIIYKGNLYMQFIQAPQNQKVLARYDGNTIRIIPDSKGGSYEYEGSGVIYKNKLYCQYSFNGTQLFTGLYDGGDYVNFFNPPNDIGEVHQPLQVYHDKLVFLAVLSDRSVGLATYDGKSMSTIRMGPAYLMKDTLYSFGQSSFGPTILKYDGRTVKPIPNLPNGHPGVTYDDGSSHQPVEWNGTMYLQYTFPDSRDSSERVVKFDGNSYSLLPLPDPGLERNTNVSGELIVYNNHLYFSASGKLARYDGKKVIKILGNQDDPDLAAYYNGYYAKGGSFVFQGKLYISYQYNLAYLDDAELPAN